MKDTNTQSCTSICAINNNLKGHSEILKEEAFRLNGFKNAHKEGPTFKKLEPANLWQVNTAKTMQLNENTIKNIEYSSVQYFSCTEDERREKINHKITCMHCELLLHCLCS